MRKRRLPAVAVPESSQVVSAVWPASSLLSADRGVGTSPRGDKRRRHISFDVNLRRSMGKRKFRREHELASGFMGQDFETCFY